MRSTTSVHPTEAKCASLPAPPLAITGTVTTARTAENLLYALRVRTFAHLQRLSLDFYDRETGGRIMTRMTTDVDQFESLVENGLLSALVSIVTERCGGVSGWGASLLVP